MRRSLWLGSILASTVTCLPDAPVALLDDLTAYEGTHVTYYTSPHLTPCAGNVAYLDAFIEFFAAQFGHGPPSGLNMLWLDDAD